MLKSCQNIHLKIIDISQEKENSILHTCFTCNDLTFIQYLKRCSETLLILDRGSKTLLIS